MRPRLLFFSYHVYLLFMQDCYVCIKCSLVVITNHIIVIYIYIMFLSISVYTHVPPINTYSRLHILIPVFHLERNVWGKCIVMMCSITQSNSEVHIEV